MSSHSDQGPEGPCRWAGRTRRGEGTFLSQRPHSPCPLGTPVSGDRVPSVGIPGSTPAADRSLPNRAGSTSKLRCLASELETDGRPETPQHVQRKSLLWRQVETWRLCSLTTDAAAARGKGALGFRRHVGAFCLFARDCAPPNFSQCFVYFMDKTLNSNSSSDEIYSVHISLWEQLIIKAHISNAGE